MKKKGFFRNFPYLYLLATSGFFNKDWYQANNPDVARSKANPLWHYLNYGGFEGRDPSPDFDSDWYLNTYPDVKESGLNPLVHYLRFGRKEGRARQAALGNAALPHPRGQRQKLKPKPQRACDFFFIVGTGRSGTTLLAQVLNAHSKIAVPAELQILFEYSNNGERLAEVFASQKNLSYQAEDYFRLIETRCPHNLLAYYDYRTFFLEQNYPIPSLKTLLTDLYTDIAYAQGKSVFAEQTPWYGQNMPLLAELFPTAKFIHLVRDGRDVAISYARTPWWHKDVNLNLERWQTEANKIENDAPRERLLTIRYEDLVLTPAEKTGEICRFLNLPFEENMLDARFHVDYSQFGREAANNLTLSPSYRNWKKDGKSAFFAGSVYGWKSNPDVEFHQPSPSVRETLARFGYAEA